MNHSPTDPETFVEEHRDAVERVLRHSSNEHARACAWALLDRALSDPELEQLRAELDRLERRREVA